MTVSNVLRAPNPAGRLLYSEETAQRVLKVAQEMGYIPNRAARAMRTQKTGVVGFVAANFSEETGTVENFGVHPFVVGLNHVLTPTGRHVVLVEMNELELQQTKALPAALRERFFDALVVHYGLSSHALHLLEEFKVPLICWDTGSSSKRNCVFRDEKEVGRAVTRRLLDLGHRRIAFHISRNGWKDLKAGRASHYSLQDRYEGYVSALAQSKLRPKALLGYDAEELASQMEKGRITAVVTQGPVYMQLLRGAIILGKRIPEDISVLSCDVESSVKDRGASAGGALYNRYEAGRIVGALLIHRLENGGVPVENRCLPVEVAEGQTAARPPREEAEKRQ